MLSVFPIDVLGEIWDVIESVSEGFLTYYHCQYEADELDSIVSYIQVYMDK